MYMHPTGRPRCFVFDKLIANLRDSNTSKPKRTVTPFYVYVSHLAFSVLKLPARVGFAKISINPKIQNNK